ncbi:LacI family DNA-binding transcriptional regulator [Burkholderia multivorans]|uniref:LacI family DNA-binding transcriptional regulator n=1 Tax=Burkholderia multivorans TaxID=87883 RepID=UPI001C225AEA|nr:LacI family DNA-binding transcriptional regulator [Burkholderia multivorans]MBU9160413.1 LacI family transcriptional regulator [Burkholderia multivorans]MBU9258899.1 LacI family transcriptional regulator [Burkholderia multivorans]MBU9487341.1 LacI family transcriptional regulator [Burkholderia multivorans]MBU9541682.1 LacI family transcriptional regulator [Burkholderia multivorans]MCA8173249.1 LacI family transcriptional regulator [Burkholderia multivorans]
MQDDMSTIQDVARHAAVSVSTVSNVLNGRTDQMKPETLERVKAAMDALQYRPSTLARQLKTGQTPLVGLLVPSMANPMYGYIAREVEACAQEQYGHRVLIGNTYRDARKEASFFDDLFAHGVRRVIVISSLADESHLERAAARGMAVVSYDRRATPGEASKVDHVTADNEAAARLATRCLIDAGHTRLAFATVAGMTVSRSDKIRGFQGAARDAGLDAHARVLDGGPANEYGDAVIVEVGRALGAALADDPARPTGIVAVNDLFALGLMAGLRDGGLRVPDDVSVVGMDGHFLSAISSPALTTVQLPVPEMAAEMVRRVMRQDGDTRHAPESCVFTGVTLVARASVAPPPSIARSGGDA